MIHFIENDYADNYFDSDMCTRSIKGTLVDNQYIGGYKSRLLALIKTDGNNICTLTRKERRELNCLTVTELKEYSVDGDQYESDDEDEIDQFDGSALAEIQN